MASQEGQAAADLDLYEKLQDEPFRFGFLAAMRWLEAANPEHPRFGMATRPGDEPVRLGQEPSMAFAPSTLDSFDSGTEHRPPLLSVLFFGLFGPNGALPLHLTEYARQRVRHNNDPTFRAFANIFHHRALSLFYRAWSRAHPAPNFDRPDEDRFSMYVGSLFGFGGEVYRDRDALDDLSKLHLAGRFSAQARNPEGLEAILHHYFDVQAQIEEFVGEWIELPRESLCKLGGDPVTGTLGESAIVGERVWECQHKFRIVLGAIGYQDFQRFLPGSDALPKLMAAVRNYTGDSLNWDLQVILKKEEVPDACLGKSGALGWNAWLLNRPPEDDLKDMILQPVG